MEYLFLLSRVLFGGFWIYHGLMHLIKGNMMTPYAASKGVPLSALAVYGSGILVLLGGLGILSGAYVEWAVAALAVFLVPTTLIMHAFWKVADPMQRMTEMIMFTKNVALLGGTLAYLFIPTPWAFSFF